MTWTTEKPTQPGWYWYRGSVSDLDPVIVLAVVLPQTGILTVLWATRNQAVSEVWTGQWAGPLKKPTGDAKVDQRPSIHLQDNYGRPQP